MSGARTVDDPQDLAQHLGLGSEQEGQRLGKVSTHYRMGCFGRTGSTRCTALSTIRYAPHDGQKPRRLQEKASDCGVALDGQKGVLEQGGRVIEVP